MDAPMEPLDKAAMGRRIKQIRTGAGLRQWQLAERLGTTQSAVHKYEHGVVPEPRRLVELARVGQTTVEWILTGSHWEDGDTSQERLSREVYRIARAAASLTPEQLKALGDALTLLDRAADLLTRAPDREPDAPELEVALATAQELAATRHTLQAALGLHRTILEAALEMEARRFGEVAGAAREDRGGKGR
jgi:transcriptional regulator with XRE-family HTH domain